MHIHLQDVHNSMLQNPVWEQLWNQYKPFIEFETLEIDDYKKCIKDLRSGTDKDLRNGIDVFVAKASHWRKHGRPQTMQTPDALVAGWLTEQSQTLLTQTPSESELPQFKESLELMKKVGVAMNLQEGNQSSASLLGILADAESQIQQLNLRSDRVSLKNRANLFNGAEDSLSALDSDLVACRGTPLDAAEISAVTGARNHLLRTMSESFDEPEQFDPSHIAHYKSVLKSVHDLDFPLAKSVPDVELPMHFVDQASDLIMAKLSYSRLTSKTPLKERSVSLQSLKANITDWILDKMREELLSEPVGPRADLKEPLHIKEIVCKVDTFSGECAEFATKEAKAMELNHEEECQLACHELLEVCNGAAQGHLWKDGLEEDADFETVSATAKTTIVKLVEKTNNARRAALVEASTSY